MKHLKSHELEGMQAEMGYLLEECTRLPKELAERGAVIRFIVKGAAVIEKERDEFERLYVQEVPFLICPVTKAICDLWANGRH
jgi:hypothetical protein